MAKQLGVARFQSVGYVFPRVQQQVTAVMEVPGAWHSVPRQEGSMSMEATFAKMEETNHKPPRSYKHTFSTQRKYKEAFFLHSKVCRVAVWPTGTPTRGMATASLTWESVLSEENKASVRARLAKIQSPRLLHQQGTSRAAAVLVPLCHVEGELSLLYTLRCLSMAAHAGEISFPGGMADPGDRDEVHTALREAQEEVGIRGEESVEVLGVMPPVSGRAEGSQVVGVLAYVGHLDPDTLTLSPGEVEAVIAASLKNLCHSANARQTQFRSTKMSSGYTLPVFLGTEPRVWGLTAIFTHMALTALLPGLYTHHLRHIAPLHR